ncbi:MAG: hypothetical protein ACR2OA_15830 [Rubripirellula sp.]
MIEITYTGVCGTSLANSDSRQEASEYRPEPLPHAAAADNRPKSESANSCSTMAVVDAGLRSWVGNATPVLHSQDGAGRYQRFTFGH